MKFNPNYQITAATAQALMRIESVRQLVHDVPLTAKVLHHLRESARLATTHYSTFIEGNRLSLEQIVDVIAHDEHIPGRERDEREVKGYYAALQMVEQLVARGQKVDETIIQTLHGLVMAGGKERVQPTPYRDGQNVIKDSRSKRIVYLPPEAKDVPELMQQLVNWIQSSKDIPCPIVAGIAHYQFATIHPYYDGNGRTARLLATYILHAGGYDLKGLYSLEEYYAQNLSAYYDALDIGPSHNYYMGRETADITKWVDYFCDGMAVAFERVVRHMQLAKQQGEPDYAALLRLLDPQQRKIVELLTRYETITSQQVADLFGFSRTTAASLCKKWVEEGFLIVIDPNKKEKRYTLSDYYGVLIKK